MQDLLKVGLTNINNLTTAAILGCNIEGMHSYIITQLCIQTNARK